MDRIGIRELRQNLSVHLRRVKRGESLEVTEHGRPVAMLAPLPSSRGVRDALLTDGRLAGATSSLASLGAPPTVDGDPNLTEALEAEREERL